MGLDIENIKKLVRVDKIFISVFGYVKCTRKEILELRKAVYDSLDENYSDWRDWDNERLYQSFCGMYDGMQSMAIKIMKAIR